MANTTESEKQVSLWPSIIQFSLYYFVASLILQLAYFVYEPLSEYDFGIGMGILFLSAGIAIRRFVADYQRPFTRREQASFAFLVIVASLVIGTGIFALALALGTAPDMSNFTGSLEETLTFIIIFVAVFFAILFGLLYFLAGAISRRLSRMLAEKGKI